MVFQRPTPFPKSIFHNIALPLAVHGVPRQEVPGRVETALKRVGLWGEVESRLSASALTLSGGQQQRLCIARALAVNPDVLLMDEPASALDPKSRRHIDELIASLRGQVTVVLVTHHLDEARQVGNQLGVLINGRLEAFGPVGEVSRSANEMVAQYLDDEGTL
jgi:phosphate transport system ATP-binding protein